MTSTGRFPRAGIGMVLLATVLCAGCRGGDADYFPVGGGQTWDYEVRMMIKGERHVQRLLLTSLSPAEVDGAEYFPQVRLNDRVDLYRRDKNGIVRVNLGDGELRVLPAELKPKASWRTPGQIMFLEITGAFHATFQERKKQYIDLDYVIETMDDTVAVGAGRFTNCMRIKSSGSMYAGGTLQEFLGIGFIQVEQTEWYAPGVGLIKRVRKESTTPADWSNEYEQELVAMN